MKCVICTLFENHYHFGVAALINSLYDRGFRGTIYAGYRGKLPSWADSALEDFSLMWPNNRLLQLPEGTKLYFLPLETNYHFTNFKPDFMNLLWEGPANNAENLFYFDPDMVVTEPWTFFKDWVENGIALCEDVNSPLSKNHPRRMAWRKYFNIKNITLTFKDNTYANGGFIGISRQQKGFLDVWKQIQEAMAPAIGGLNRSALNGAPLPLGMKGHYAPFGKTDQDALNAAIEAWHGDISFVGQEGMAFKSGVPILPHALGSTKPWQWKPLIQGFAGRPPRVVDIEYWKSANGIISTHPKKKIYFQLLTLKIAGFLGRFYRRR